MPKGRDANFFKNFQASKGWATRRAPESDGPKDKNDEKATHLEESNEGESKIVFVHPSGTPILFENFQAMHQFRTGTKGTTPRGILYAPLQQQAAFARIFSQFFGVVRLDGKAKIPYNYTEEKEA